MSALKKLSYSESDISENSKHHFLNPPDSTMPLKALISLALEEKTEKTRNMIEYTKAVPKDFGKDWYAYYTVNKKPYKFRGGINRIKSEKERRWQLQRVCNAINDLFESGWRPKKGKQLIINAEKTIVEAIEYVLEVKSKTVDAKTMVSYRATSKKFVKWLEDNHYNLLYCNQITYNYIVAFLDYLKLKVPAGTSINNDIRFIKTIFNEIEERELITVNPTKKVKIPKVAKGKTNTPLTPDEFKKVSKFLKECKEYPRLHIHAGFIYNCALRPKEIMLLKIKDIKFDIEQIDVRADISKNNKKQPIAIPPIFLKQLEYLKEYDPEWFVFGFDLNPSPKRMGTNHSSSVWKKLIKEGLGIDKDEYSLKHSRAIHMYLDGASIHEIQVYLRHASPSETENYMRTMIAFISKATLNKTREF